MRLAFVVPRYGTDIAGGAETLCRDYAERLTGAGHDVTVLTTCARDHFTWANDLPAGGTRVNGVRVERHPVSVRKDDTVMYRLEMQIAAGGRVRPRDAATWVRNTGFSEALMDRVAAIADSVDALVFMPYLFATTGFGAGIRPDRSIVIPCLHDEAYARFPLLQEAMRGARGLVFNSHGEQQLAARLLGTLPPSAVVGWGVDPQPGADPERFRRSTGVRGDAVCYAGRREAGKNWPLLLQWMTLYSQVLSRAGPATLVTMGHGDIEGPPASRKVVRDLGFLDQQAKLDAMAASVAVAQLSINESFSYVLFESWLAGTPVIVHGHAEVTRGHCELSGGGLWASSAEEFAVAVDRLRADTDLRAALAAQGRRYAVEEYAWPAVLHRLEQAITGFMA